MTGITYRKQSLSQHGGDSRFNVKAGDRMPYFLVDGESGYHKLNAPGFHLLLFSDGTTNYDSLKNDAETAFSDALDVLVLPLYPALVEAFGTPKPFMVLLRPDNHIALIDNDTSLVGLTNYFDSKIIGLSQSQYA